MPERSVTIRVEGARELRRALKKAQDLRTPVLKEAYQEAADWVAQRVRSRIPLGDSGSAQAAIVGWSTLTKGFVGQRNRKDVPYYGWLDWGTRNPRTGYTKQDGHGPWFGTGKISPDGRYLYPVVEESVDETAKILEKAIDTHLHNADLT